MGADAGLNRAAEKRRDGEGGEARVLRCTDYSLPRTTLALALWLGGIHFNVLLVLASLFLFSRRAAAIVVAFQLFFMFAPVNDRDKWGRSIARFICRHAMGYFPISLHVEDYKSFDPSRAYEFVVIVMLVFCICGGLVPEKPPETHDHLLTACVFTREVWHRLLHRVGFTHLCPAADSKTLDWWLLGRSLVPETFRRGFDSLVLLVSWMIWKERNKRTFDGICKTPAQIVDLIKDEAGEWIAAGFRSISPLFSS